MALGCQDVKYGYRIVWPRKFKLHRIQLGREETVSTIYCHTWMLKYASLRFSHFPISFRTDIELFISVLLKVWNKLESVQRISKQSGQLWVASRNTFKQTIGLNPSVCFNVDSPTKLVACI